MDCEMCGRRDVRIDALVDGVKMRVCEQCSRFGKVVYVEPPPSKDGKGIEASSQKVVTETEVVEDYSKVVKAAREKTGMTCKELAAAIDEKESYLDRIEKGHAAPTEKVAKKLEKYLKIRLFEEVAESGGPLKGQTKAQGLTLGDMVDVKGKKK